MNNLQRFEQNGLELIINLSTGEVFASQGAIARICQCESTQIRRFRGDSQLIKTLPVKDSRGVCQETKLYPEQLIKECLAKFNPELLLKCVDAGLRLYLHGLAGFKYEVKQPDLPQTYLEALKALVASEEEKQKLLKEKEENAPLVNYAKAVQFSEDSVDFNTYAKMLGGVGRNRLMQQCRNCHVLMQNSTLPYQRWQEAGYFEVSQEINAHNGKLIPFTLITGKGQIWLKQRLDAHEELTRKTIGAISQSVLAMSGY